MTVAVVTDASAAIGAEQLAAAGVLLLPLHVLTRAGEFLDDGSPLPTECFVADGITTSGPAPGEVREVLGRALERGGDDGVVVIVMSSHLSSTYSVVSSVAAQLDGAITVIDSRSVDMAMGFAVLAAARAAATGADRHEVAEAAHAVLAESEGYFCVATLDHLRAGGRIGPVVAMLGGALSIVPVLRVADGRIVTVRKTRTFSRARDQVIDIAVAHAGGAPARMAVHHVGAPDVAEAVAKQLRARVPELEQLVVGCFSGTIAAHLGPGAVGVSVAPAS